jgi:hypothetical protein
MIRDYQWAGQVDAYVILLRNRHGPFTVHGIDLRMPDLTTTNRYLLTSTSVITSANHFTDPNQNFCTSELGFGDFYEHIILKPGRFGAGLIRKTGVYTAPELGVRKNWISF